MDHHEYPRRIQTPWTATAASGACENSEPRGKSRHQNLGDKLLPSLLVNHLSFGGAQSKVDFTLKNARPGRRWRLCGGTFYRYHHAAVGTGVPGPHHQAHDGVVSLSWNWGSRPKSWKGGAVMS